MNKLAYRVSNAINCYDIYHTTDTQHTDTPFLPQSATTRTHDTSHTTPQHKHTTPHFMTPS
jgi:hypothetical protein